MNPFDGLVPPRVTPPPLPFRGGPETAVAAAAALRRDRAVKVVGSTGAASVAAAGLIALRPAPGTDAVVPEPGATRGPAVTATASPAATTTPPPPSRISPTSVGTGAAATGTPSPTATAGRVNVPGGPPSRVTPPAGRGPRLTRWVTVDIDAVPDRSGENCAVTSSTGSPSATLCSRVLAPASAKSGTPVDLLFEICARGTSVDVGFEGDQETLLELKRVESGSPGTVVWRARERPRGVGAHTATIPAGYCRRYTFRWDGRDDAGAALPPGDYLVSGSPMFTRDSYTALPADRTMTLAP